MNKKELLEVGRQFRSEAQRVRHARKTASERSAYAKQIAAARTPESFARANATKAKRARRPAKQKAPLPDVELTPEMVSEHQKHVRRAWSKLDPQTVREMATHASHSRRLTFPRCPCGHSTLKRAQTRSYECCKHALCKCGRTGAEHENFQRCAASGCRKFRPADNFLKLYPESK